MICAICKLTRTEGKRVTCPSCFEGIRKRASIPLELAIWAATRARGCQAKRNRQQRKEAV